MVQRCLMEHPNFCASSSKSAPVIDETSAIEKKPHELIDIDAPVSTTMVAHYAKVGT